MSGSQPFGINSFDKISIGFSNLTCGVIPTGDHAEKPSKESVFDEPI
jgi:hypothetical protein